MPYEEKLRIGWDFAYVRVPITDDRRTMLTNTGTPPDEALEGLCWPAVSQYAGRTQSGIHIKPQFKADEETLQGVESLIDVFALEQRIDISMQLVFNGEPDIEALYQLPETGTEYDAFGGGLTIIPKFSLLLQLTNVNNPREDYRRVIQWILFDRVYADPAEIVIGKEYSTVNVTFHALTGLDSNGCPYMDGRQLYHRYYTNAAASDINAPINPRNPNTPIVNTPDDYYYLQPTAFFNL